MISKYLLPTDGSENAMRAARHVAAMMKKNPEISLTIIYVRSPAENLLKFSPWVPPEHIDKEMVTVANSIINKTKAVFDEQGLSVNTDIIMGEPGIAIGKYAKEGGFGQVVMGTRGLGNLSGIILGSVSHQVLHTAECPILFVK